MIRNKYKNDLERSRSFFYHKNVAKWVRLMFMEYNPNPTGRRVEDCSIRALTKALDWDREEVLHTKVVLLMPGAEEETHVEIREDVIRPVTK